MQSGDDSLTGLLYSHIDAIVGIVLKVLNVLRTELGSQFHLKSNVA